MKHTGALRTIVTPRQAEHVVRIHPNDGFDLGFMTYSYEVKLYSNCDAETFNRGEGEFFPGRLDQANECKAGTIELSTRLAGRLGHPERVKLVSLEDKLLLLSLPKP